MNQIIKKRICKYCLVELELSSNVFSNHVKHCSKRKESTNFSNISLSRQKEIDLKLGKFKNFDVICSNEKCKKGFQVQEREKQFPLKGKYFCSRSCANIRKHLQLTKDKIGETTSLTYKNLSDEEKISRIEKSTNNTSFRSKGEKDVLSELQKLYPHDEWKTGNVIKFKDSYLSFDIISRKLKIHIEYDGIWHFENIRGQLEDMQRKDKIVEEYILQSDFRLIRISEDIYHKNGIDILLNTLQSKEKIIHLY